jgi:uncharacterized protein (TIGR00299 family) protein
VAWFHCFSGIAGDMALGSLVDAGADLHEVRRMLERLPVGGWQLEAEPVLHNGIGATKIHVHVTPSSVVRTAAHITAMVEEARLPERVTQRAQATFAALARAEGKLHRRPPEQVHFHEVGGIDAIVDIVGTCCALELLGVDDVTHSPVANGVGMIRAAHGLLPNPAPAVVELLRDLPTYGLDIPVELTTPTGAALLAALGVEAGPLPAMRIDVAGFGAGTAELGDHPNLVQVVIGERSAALVDGQPVVALDANVDDATGEQLAHAVTELLGAGAHDAWITPIVGKKGRPAYMVSVLADPALAEQVAAVLATETGSFGIRGTTLQRWPAPRSFDTVDVDGLPVRIKVGPGRAKVEHDDAVRAARKLGRTRREIVEQAEATWRRSASGPQLEAVPDPGAGHDHHDHHDHP